MTQPTTRCRAWLAAVVVMAAVPFLAAACGGGAPSTASTTAATGGNTAQLAYSRCMRSNGVPNFPDPDSSGTFSKSALSRLEAGDSRFHSATHACAHLLPDGGRGPDEAQQQHVRALGVQFARCMRHHGVGLPDPASTGRIPDPGTLGINQGSPSFEAANQACAAYRPPYMPSNAEYNAYAATHGS